MISPATITPSELPSLPLDERRDLPDTAVIYAVLAGDTAPTPSKDSDPQSTGRPR